MCGGRDTLYRCDLHCTSVYTCIENQENSAGISQVLPASGLLFAVAIV